MWVNDKVYYGNASPFHLISSSKFCTITVGQLFLKRLYWTQNCCQPISWQVWCHGHTTAMATGVLLPLIRSLHLWNNLESATSVMPPQIWTTAEDIFIWKLRARCSVTVWYVALEDSLLTNLLTYQNNAVQQFLPTGSLTSSLSHLSSHSDFDINLFPLPRQPP